jgi:hypothetical protein
MEKKEGGFVSVHSFILRFWEWHIALGHYIIYIPVIDDIPEIGI